MGDITVTNSPLDIRIEDTVTIEPLTIARIQHIAPAAIHVKELNHVDPLSIESLKIDEVRNIDPVRVDRFNVTHLPTVNLSVGRLPELNLNVGRVPPVAIAIHQCFDLPSSYMVRTRLLGIEVMRTEINGRTSVIPRDMARREQAHTRDRSFPTVAAAGNPAIPSTLIETCAEAVNRVVPTGSPRPCAPPPAPVPSSRHAGPGHGRPSPRPASAPDTLAAGTPRFQFNLSGPSAAPLSESGVSFGG